MPAWPANLPQGMLRGFEVRIGDNVIRTDMDTGIAKLRRRSSYTPIEADGEIVCSQAQVMALELFYLETTAAGTIRFGILSPHTDQPMDARFREPPRFSWIGGDYFQCALKLELIVSSIGASGAIWPDGTGILWPDGSNALWPA